MTTMKGLILASDAANSRSVLGVEGLRPLMGRPFATHVLDQMVLHGIREIDVILDTPNPLDYEKALGDGMRHGVTLRYHLVRDPGRPGPHLRRMKGPVLMALAHRLLNGAQCPDATRAPSCPIVFCAPVRTDSDWAGWAILPAGVLSQVPPDVDLASLSDWLLNLGDREGLLSSTSLLLAADNAGLLLRAHDAAFDTDILQARGRPAVEGIRVGRDVIVDASARLIAPVFLGDHVRVGANAVVGPSAFIGSGAVIGRSTVVRHAVVTRRTCVGERLDIEHAVATGRGLASAVQSMEIHIHDPFILSPMSRSPIDLRGGVQRTIAGMAFLAGVPLEILATVPLLASGYRLRRRPIEAEGMNSRTWRWEHPTDTNRETRPTFRDLLLRVIPGLPDVIRGALPLVGREAWLPSDASDTGLPAGFIERLTALRPGLLSAALVEGDPQCVVRRLADLTHASRPSLRADLGLVVRYFAAALTRLRDFDSGRSVANAMPMAATMKN